MDNNISNDSTNQSTTDSTTESTKKNTALSLLIKIFTSINISPVVCTFLLAIVSTLAAIFTNTFSNPDYLIRIGKTVQVNDNFYITSVQIKCFSSSSLENIYLTVPASITLADINCNVPLNINIEENNIGSQNKTTFIITRVNRPDNAQLVIQTHTKFPPNEQISVGCNNIDKIRVEFFNTPEACRTPLLTKGDIISISCTILVYILAVLAIKIIATKHNKENRKEIDRIQNEHANTISSANLLISNLNSKISNFEKNLKTSEARNAKQRIIYQAKLRDYKLEIDFWKDTIRKILYGCKTSRITQEKLFEEVTNNLKTYRTNHDMDKTEFDATVLLAKFIAHSENESKEEESK